MNSIETYEDTRTLSAKERKEISDFRKKADEEYKRLMREDDEPKKEKKKDKKIKTSEPKILILSKYENKDCLYEQTYSEGLVGYAKYNKLTGEITSCTAIEQSDGTLILPIQDEEVTKGAVRLPTKPEPYNTDEELDQEIKDFILEWLDIPKDYLQFAIWNIKRSWIYERFHTLNYLRALGDTGQGKSRFLDVLGSLHYKPIFTSGATTAAPVFRIIDKWRGTMIFDEADLKITDETADIIKIINMGYEKGKHVLRCDQNDATKILFFDPFCPKILATRKPFTDKAVESRCVTQVMLGTKRKNIRFTLTDDFFKKSEHLRNMLLTWRFKNLYKIDPSKDYDIGISDLEPRVQQIVSSYISLFGENNAEMGRFREFVKAYQEELIEERSNSWEGLVVKGIYELFHEGQVDISSIDIINKSDITNHKGELLKPRALTNVLKELGFGKTIMRRINDKIKRTLPLDPEHLEGLFKRYGCNVSTIVTVLRGTGDKDTLDSFIINTEKSNEGLAPPNTRYNRYSVTDDVLPEVDVEDIIHHND